MRFSLFGNLHRPRNGQIQRVPGDKMAKVVMVKKENGTPVMLVLPASYRVNFSWLWGVLGTRTELEKNREDQKASVRRRILSLMYYLQKIQTR